MAQSPTPAIDVNFSQQLLGEFLIQQGLLTAEQFDEAQARLAEQEAPDALPLGPAYVPSADGKSLLVLDPRKGTVQHTIGLFAGDPGDPEAEVPGRSRYTDGPILVIENADTPPKRWLPTSHAPRLGLIPTPRGAFLYAGEEPRRDYSPRLMALPSPFTHPPGASGPVDLYAAAGGEYLVAANRGAGTVHVLLTASNEQRGAISVRAAGHTKGIGVAISPDGRTIYLSDGLTPRLAILDVTTFKVRHQLFPTGPLGALSMSADGASMIVAFTKGAQEMGLMTLSLPDLRVRHLMNLPGKGEGDRPALPLIGTPDEPLAYLAVYSYETRDAHYLLAVDRQKHRVLKSYPLKEMPLAIATLAPETWCPEPPDLGELLVTLGLVTAENVQFARSQLQGTSEDAALTLGAVPINPSILAQLPERLIRDRGVLPLNQLDGQLIVAMTNPRDPRARQFVQDLAGDLVLRVLPMSQAEFETFMEERYPRLMDQQAAQPTPVLPEPQELTATVPPPKPQPKPAAKPLVKGAVQDPPKQALSIDQWAALPGDRFLMINPIKRQVAELDRTGKASWLYSPEGDVLTRQLAGFVHAGRLPNGNTLLVDFGSNRVSEVTASKEIAWQSQEEAKLKGPRHAVRLQNGSTLAVDTGNNRLVELDAEGRITWQYGEMGCSGNGLFKPQYVSVLGTGRLLVTDGGNHRVIELDPGKGIAWQYGNAANRLGGGQGKEPNQLFEPTSATRLPNGNTLIVDGGNHRVIEVDSLGALIWSYRPNALKGGQGVKDPQLALRLDNGHTIVAGRQGICEVDAELTIAWEYHLVPVGPPAQPTRTQSAAPPAPAIRVAAESDLPVGLPSHFLQADRIQHRVWEVDRAKEIVWQYTGLGTPGSDRAQLDRPHYAKRLRNGNTLITDTGHHRILEVTPEGTIAWEFGQKGKLGNGPKHLANPRSAERLTNAHTLIADQSNKRVIEVSPAGEVTWSFEGGPQHLQAPTYATMMASGNLLVVDWGGHVVYEVTPQAKIVWSYGQFGRSGAEPGLLFHPEHASRLPNGDTLISDTQNHRVLQVSSVGEVVWQCGGDSAHLPRIGRFGMQFSTPVAAWRLPTGNVVMQHAGKGHVVEVDRELNILFQFTP